MRWAACALLSIAASGWFNSCASDPDSSPSIATRDRCASSLRCCAVSASTFRRAVISTIDASTAMPSGVSMGLRPTSTGTSLPSLRRPCRSLPRAHRAGRRCPVVIVAVAGMAGAKRLGEQHFDGTPEQLFAGIAEDLLGLGVEQDDMPLPIRHDHGVGGSLHREAHALFPCLRSVTSKHEPM